MYGERDLYAGAAMVLQRLGAAFIVFVALAACSGDDGETAAADAPSTTTTIVAATTTTAAPTTTTVPTPPTTPPPYSFDGSVPPPALINTGDDYAAIFESLDAYGGWLLAHNPDAELAREAYVQGTSAYERLQSSISNAIENDLRLVDVRDATEVEVVDVALPIVSLRVVENGERFQAFAVRRDTRRRGSRLQSLARHASGRRDRKVPHFER